MVLGSVLDWDSGSDSLAALAGVGTIGDTIGTTTEGYVITTTRIFRIAGPSSIATLFGRIEGTSTVALIAAAAPAGDGSPMHPPSRTPRPECIPVPSAGSTTAGLRNPTLPEDNPALAASMEAGGRAAEEAAAFTAEAVIDSSYEVIQL